MDQKLDAKSLALDVVSRAAPSELDLFEQRWAQFGKYGAPSDSVTPAAREGAFGGEIVWTVVLSAIIFPIASEIAKGALKAQVDEIAKAIQRLLERKRSTVLSQEQIADLAVKVFEVVDTRRREEKDLEPKQRAD